MTEDPCDDALPYRVGDGETTLRLRVTPRSGATSVGGIACDANGRAALVVRVTAPPEKGKANQAVIATLAKRLKIAKSRLTITAGLAERNKIVAISGDPAEFQPALRGLLKPDTKD